MNNVISTADYAIHTGTNAITALAAYLQNSSPTQIMVLTDHNTARDCLPRLQKALGRDLLNHSIAPGEMHKTIASCEQIWQVMTDRGMDRKSLLINLGGGFVGDLGGFTAACYKRGIAFVQVPTTLLAMVDASVGGKTGVNFAHFKNQVGAFANPAAVIVDPGFLATLSPRELRSGYAEVLKHCLIADAPRWAELANLTGLPADLTAVITASIQVKANIVAQDPREAGLRKGLNFGHTIGHALESWFMDQTASLLHGEAVAMGMVCESFLSHRQGTLNSADLAQITSTLLRLYGKVEVPASARETIASLALQDKKNRDRRILSTLLDGIGKFRYDAEISSTDILDSLHYYAEFPHD